MKVSLWHSPDFADFAEYAEKPSASNRIAEITLIRYHYDFRLVSSPRIPCNPRNPRFRTQRKYEIPKLTLIMPKTLHTPTLAIQKSIDNKTFNTLKLNRRF